MKRVATAATVAIATAFATSARADRYEAAIVVEPHGGMSWVREDGASEAARVPGGGAAVRLSYGLRDWLAVEGEVGGFTLGEAKFEGVDVAIGGAPPGAETLTRTTRGARLIVGANLRLGVAWIPTLSLGVGAQARLRGDATVMGTDLVPDGRAGGLSVDPIVAARAGLERRLNARWVVGASVGAAHALTSPTIDTVEVSFVISRYWYPLWW